MINCKADIGNPLWVLFSSEGAVPCFGCFEKVHPPVAGLNHSLIKVSLLVSKHIFNTQNTNFILVEFQSLNLYIP